ncbi:MAG: amidohydrolase family protein [Lentisphaeraceae bacterium]|nr:amidohydrolase family protein [Lentisphaeraceae bacterium]
MKIDAHQHFWNYSVEEYDWIDDDMAILRNDFLPQHLDVELRKSGIDAAIAVQARCTVEETEWLLKLADENESVAGVVGWLDLKSDGLEEQLKKYTDNPYFLGLREILQGQESEFMLEEKFVAGLKLLAKYDVAYDILVLPKHLTAVRELLTKLPDQRLIVDHLAKPRIAAGYIDDWKVEHGFVFLRK